MVEHPRLAHFNSALNVKMATLAECREVPVGNIRFVIVQVVDSEAVAGEWLVDVTAALADPMLTFLDAIFNFVPIRGILALEFSHCG
jgi:hypothetical protein